MSAILNLTILLLISEVALLAYVYSAWGQFVFDDLLITDKLQYNHRKRTGGTLKDLWHDRRNKRAFLWWTYQRDMLAHGPFDGSAWHYTNMAVHVICSCLVYAILLWWFSLYGALAGALLFAVDPLGTASVSSIAGRSSLLCGAFYLASILAFLAGFWYLIPVLFLFGFKSKEEIVMLPLALIVIWRFA